MILNILKEINFKIFNFFYFDEVIKIEEFDFVIFYYKKAILLDHLIIGLKTLRGYFSS